MEKMDREDSAQHSDSPASYDAHIRRGYTVGIRHGHIFYTKKKKVKCRIRTLSILKHPRIIARKEHMED